MERWTAVLLALTIAGCTRGGETDNAPREPSYETVSIPIDVQAGGLPAPPPVGNATGAAGEVEVGANATAILVEARWTCQSPTCGFDLVLLDPAGSEIVRSSGAGEAAAGAENVTAGTYAVQLAYGSDPIVGAQGEIRASVFHGGGIPDRFSAFGPGP